MAKIKLIKKYKIEQITLEINEACPIENCDYSKDCAGKNSTRDNNFRCNLQELVLLYKRAARKNIK